MIDDGGGAGLAGEGGTAGSPTAGRSGSAGALQGAGAGGQGQGGRAGNAGNAGQGIAGTGTAGVPSSVAWEAKCTDSACRESAPAPRQGATAAFDPIRNEVLLYGGETIGNSVLAETWGWNGTRWTEHCADNACNSALGTRYGSAVVFDPERESVVLFGGLEGPNVQTCQNATFAWNGSTWTALAPDDPPPARYSAGMAYDTARKVTVLFGGSCENIPLGGTYELGTDWREACVDDCVSTAPSARSAIAMAYDAARGVTVLFGGALADGVSDETFLWDGSAWSAADPATRPAPRAGARMVYDSFRQRIVLFGGTNFTEAFADTWEWDGTDWRLIAGGPEPRHRSALAFDSERNRVVLFGGAYDPSSDPQAQLNDTWELVAE